MPDDAPHDYVWIVDYHDDTPSYFGGPTGDWIVAGLLEHYPEDFELRIFGWD